MDKTIAKVTFKYREIVYEVKVPLNGFDCEESVTFAFDEGNYSCDCNRSLFIQQQCDPDFEEMDCGGEIELVSLNLE